MSVLTPAGMATCLYPEIINEITRNDETIVTAAIAAAVKEATMYLWRYNAVALLGDHAEAPDITDPFLLQLIKDMAAWRLIQLAQPNTEYAARKQAYDYAITTLKAISEGTLVQPAWLQATEQPTEEIIYSTSNTKRNNY